MRRGPRADGRRSRFAGLRCHRAHRFSRRKPWRRYRNLIKISAAAGTLPRSLRNCATERRLREGKIAAPALMKSPISSPLAPSRFQMAFWPLLAVRLAVTAAPKARHAMSILLEQTILHRPRRPASRCLRRHGRIPVGYHPRDLPTLSFRRTEAQSRPHRTADPVAGMDRRRAGADRSGIAAMAGPPPRL